MRVGNRKKNSFDGKPSGEVKRRRRLGLGCVIVGAIFFVFTGLVLFVLLTASPPIPPELVMLDSADGVIAFDIGPNQRSLRNHFLNLMSSRGVISRKALTTHTYRLLNILVHDVVYMIIQVSGDERIRAEWCLATSIKRMRWVLSRYILNKDSNPVEADSDPALQKVRTYYNDNAGRYVSFAHNVLLVGNSKNLSMALAARVIDENTVRTHSYVESLFLSRSGKKSALWGFFTDRNNRFSLLLSRVKRDVLKKTQDSVTTQHIEQIALHASSLNGIFFSLESTEHPYWLLTITAIADTQTHLKELKKVFTLLQKQVPQRIETIRILPFTTENPNSMEIVLRIFKVEDVLSFLM